MIADNPEQLRKIKELASASLSEKQLSTVSYLRPAAVDKELEKLAESTSSPSANRLHGYDVQVEFKKISMEEQKRKQRMIRKLLVSTTKYK